MNILPDISLISGVKKNTGIESAAARYFEAKDNSIFDLSDYSLSIEDIIENDFENASQTDYPFENLSQKHDEKYYSSGTIPVAVIDMFGETPETETCATEICNVIKYINPNISITKFDNSPSATYNSMQKNLEKLISENKDFANFVNKNKFLKDLSDNFLPGVNDSSIEKCLNKINNSIKNGKSFRAINISFDRSCTYSELNRLVIQELEEQITPQNFLMYKNAIKEVLNTKKEKSLFSKGQKVNIGQMIRIIEKIENTGIPVFLSSISDKNEKTFNFWSLANNAKSFETKAGQKKNLPLSAPAALAKAMKEFST